MNMKKVFASALIALFAFVACNGEDLPPVDNGDQNQTETPGGEDPGEEPGEEPGGEQEPPAVFEWPNDPTAFDYDLDLNESRNTGGDPAGFFAQRQCGSH